MRGLDVWWIPDECEPCPRQLAVCARLTWLELAPVSLPTMVSVGAILIKYQPHPCALPQCGKLRPLRRFRLSAFGKVHQSHVSRSAYW
jgi:hypothetical protein